MVWRIQNPIASTEKEKRYKDLLCIVLLYSHKQTGEIKAKLFQTKRRIEPLALVDLGTIATKWGANKVAQATNSNGEWPKQKKENRKIIKSVRPSVRVCYLFCAKTEHKQKRNEKTKQIRRARAVHSQMMPTAGGMHCWPAVRHFHR